MGPDPGVRVVNEVIIFYASQVYWEFKTEKEYTDHRRNSLIDSEIYNGAYVWHRTDNMRRHWYRMDGTPQLLEDVPKALRVWVLVLS